jgi:hypothetical protein
LPPYRVAFAPMQYNPSTSSVATAAADADTQAVLVRTNTAILRVLLPSDPPTAPPTQIPSPSPSPPPQPPTELPIYRFKMTAELQPDVYSLWAYHPRTHRAEKWGCAYVSDIATSHQLNRMFRRIRENECLDYIEESDDETDFEDARPDKYVNLSVEYSVLCQWVPYCNKWKPVRIDEASLYNARTTQIVSAPVLCNVMKQNRQHKQKPYYSAMSHRTTHLKLKHQH